MKVVEGMKVGVHNYLLMVSGHTANPQKTENAARLNIIIMLWADQAGPIGMTYSILIHVSLL